MVKYSLAFFPAKQSDRGMFPSSSIICARWSSSRENRLPDLGSNKKSPVTSSKTRHAMDHISAEALYEDPKITCSVCWGQKSNLVIIAADARRRKATRVALGHAHDVTSHCSWACD